MNNKIQPIPMMLHIIGNIPTSYAIAMSYEEQLLCLKNYLEKEVVPTMNKNIQEIKTLITYINNYFENLDLQDEVNNKIEEMYESGQLQEIITEYLQINGVIAFDTITDLKNSTNLINGTTAKTNGYHSINDGGSATYKIRTITNEDVIDESFIIALTNNNTLVAELIYSSPINILQLGAKNDNSADVSTIINNATQKENIFIPAGLYKVSNQINLYKSICGENYVRSATTNINDSILVSDIICDYNDREELAVLNIDNLIRGGNIKNIGINLKNYESGINGTAQAGHYINFDGISIRNLKSSGINVSHPTSRGLYMNNISIFGTAESYENTTGIKIGGTDYKVSNIEIMGCRVGCDFNGFVEGSNYHIWCGSMLNGDGIVNHTENESWFGNTKCLYISQCALDNIYLDTAFYKICGKGNVHNANSRMISNLKIYDDNSIPTYTSGTGVNFQNWNGVVSNFSNLISPINYKGTMSSNVTYSNVRNLLGVPLSTYLTGGNFLSTKNYNVSYNIVKDITNTTGKIIEVAKIKCPSWRSGILEVYLFHTPVRVHKIELYFYEGYYNGCKIDNGGSNDEKVYISTSKDSNGMYTLYLEPNTKADEYITVNANKVGGYGQVELLDLGYYDESNHTFDPDVLDSTSGLTQLIKS